MWGHLVMDRRQKRSESCGLKVVNYPGEELPGDEDKKE